jgi:hypothetical protein
MLIGKNFEKELQSVTEFWSPKVVGQVNDQYAKVAKLKGVMHNPVAENECWIVLIETVTTQHTGDIKTPLTKTIEQQLAQV